MTGMYTSNRVKVDKTKLVAALKKRGVSMAEASRRCGFESGYLSKCSYDGLMSKAMATVLELAYNIRPEDYAPEPPKKPYSELPNQAEHTEEAKQEPPKENGKEQEKEAGQEQEKEAGKEQEKEGGQEQKKEAEKARYAVPLDYDLLYQTIYSATYHAVIKAWMNEPE